MNEKVFVCPYCGKKYHSQGKLKQHINCCEDNPNVPRRYLVYKEHLMDPYEEYNYLYKKITITRKCDKCGKEYEVTATLKDIDTNRYNHYCSVSCKNSHKLSDETKQKVSDSLKLLNDSFPKVINDDVLEKYEHSYCYKDGLKYLYIFNRYLKIYKCAVCGKEFTIMHERDVTGRRYCSKECKHKYLSEHTGGYREGSGHGKLGWYAGIHCDSSWELAFVVYYKDHNMNISRCKEIREYTFDGKVHLYYPDFITDDGIIEIKGYKSDLWLSKQELNPDVKTLYKEDMYLYLDYVKNKYGADFTSMLYDKNYNNYDITLYEKMWINNGTEQKIINTSDYQNYSNEWTHGRLCTKCIIHKDKEQLTIDKDELDEYISKGWVRGSLNRQDRYSIYCYDILTKEIIQAKNVKTLSETMNAPIYQSAIRNILIAKRYIIAHTMDKLEEKINIFNNRKH